jgi:general secretion pathway protein A
MRQLAQRVSRRCHLEPLTPREVGRYIDKRLWVAHGGVASVPRVVRGGYAGTDAGPTPAEFWRVRFTPAAVRTVAGLSSGIPRLVNLLCDRALELGAESGQHTIGSSTVLTAAQELALPVSILDRLLRGRSRAAIAAVAGAVALVAVLWLAWPWLTRRSATSQPVPPSTPSAATVASPAAAASPRASEVLESADSYLVAVASFKTRQRAGEVQAETTGLGLPAFIRRNSSGDWNIVLVGPFISRDEAVAAQDRLARSGFRDSKVIVENAAGSPPGDTLGAAAAVRN